MAIGGNMVKLVVQLLADAKNFAGELSKSTKAVDDAAKKMTKDLADVSKEVAEETTKAVKELDTALEAAATDVKETTDKMEQATVEAAKESVQAQINAQGKLRDAKGRYLKKGTVEYEQAMKQMQSTTSKATSSMTARFLRLGVSIGKHIAAGAAKAGRAIRDFTERAASEMQRLGSSMARIGAVVWGGVTVGLGGAAKSAATFEKAMAKATSVLEDADYNPQFIEKIRRGIDEIAVKFGVDAVDAVRAFTDAIQSGVPAAQALDFLAIAAEGAVAGNAELSQATSYMISMMNAYNLKSTDAAKSTGMWKEMMDATFKAIVLGRVEFKDLATQIADLAPIAKQAGLDYKDMLAAIATSSLVGKPTSQVMTTLRAALAGLANQEQQTMDTAKALGIEFDLNAVQTKGLAAFTEELRLAIEKNAGGLDVYRTKVSKTGKVTKELDFSSQGVLEILVKLAGSLEAATAWADLLAGEGVILKDAMDGVHDSAGALEKTAGRIAEQDPTFLWRRMWEALKATIRDVGRAMLDIMEPILPPLFELLRVIQEWTATHPKLVAAIVMTIAAVGAFGLAVMGAGFALMFVAGVIGAVTTIGGLFVALVTAIVSVVSGLAVVSLPLLIAALFLLSPIIAALAAGMGLVVAAIAALAGGAVIAVANFDKIADWVKKNWPQIKNAFISGGTAIWNSLKTVGAQIWTVLRGYGESLIAWLNANLPAILAFVQQATNWIATVLIPKIGEFIIWLIGKFAELIMWFKTNGPSLWESIKGAWEKVKSFLSDLWDITKRVYKTIKDFFVMLKDTGWADAFLNVLDLIFKAFKLIVNIVADCIDSIGNLIRKFTEFVNNPSWGRFWALLKQLAGFGTGPGQWTSPIVSNGSGSSALSRSSAMMPSAGGSAASRMSSALTASPGNSVTNNHYNATVYQRTNEDVGEMLKRLARELQRKRGH